MAVSSHLMSPKIKWSHIIICSVISFHLVASYFISFGEMPVAGHRRVSAKFLQFIVDAKRQIWLTMKSMWQLKLFLFPNIMRFCDSGMGCNFQAFCDYGKEHSAILATRGNIKMVGHFRRDFDFMYWIELWKLHRVLRIIPSVLRIEPTSSPFTQHAKRRES